MARHFDYPTAVNGHRGYAILQNPDTGEMRSIDTLINAEISVSITKEARKPLNAPYAQNKRTGEEISGSMTMFYGSDMTWLKRQYLQAKRLGRLLRLNLYLSVIDEGGYIGTEMEKYSNVSPDTIQLSALDIDATDLETSFDFTAEDWETMIPFSEITPMAGKA